MKTIFEHIEYVKGKPHHIRKRIAFTIAVLGSTLVAFVWLVSSFANGSFVIKGSTFAMATEKGKAIAKTSNSSNQGLAAVGATSALQNRNEPARIEIVDTTPNTRQKNSEKTILPF